MRDFEGDKCEREIGVNWNVYLGLGSIIVQWRVWKWAPLKSSFVKMSVIFSFIEV